MRPDIDLGRMLGAELYARQTTPTAIAKRCSPSARTMRAYAKGELPIPPKVARELIVALDDEPFAIPEVREALVIRGRAHDLRCPPNRLEPTEIRVDTVELTLDVDESRRSAVGALLAMNLCEPLTGRARLRAYGDAAQAKIGQATVRAHWAPWNKGGYWLRLQLAPWEPAHCRLLQHALRCASTRTVYGLLAEPPTIRIARIDVAIDYPVEPLSLVLRRPWARTGRVVVSEDLEVTQYSGGLGEDAERQAKLYDFARYHEVAGPLARCEVRRNFRPQTFPRQLDEEPSPFRDVELCDLSCPDLSFGEVALLSLARDCGICWALAHLDRDHPADAKRLRVAIRKAKASPALESPRAIMEWMWPYLRELLQVQLFWHEVAPDDLQPWWYPPVPTESDWSTSGPELSPS